MLAEVGTSRWRHEGKLGRDSRPQDCLPLPPTLIYYLYCNMWTYECTHGVRAPATLLLLKLALARACSDRQHRPHCGRQDSWEVRRVVKRVRLGGKTHRHGINAGSTCQCRRLMSSKQLQCSRRCFCVSSAALQCSDSIRSTLSPTGVLRRSWLMQLPRCCTQQHTVTTCLQCSNLHAHASRLLPQVRTAGGIQGDALARALALPAVRQASSPTCCIGHALDSSV